MPGRAFYLPFEQYDRMCYLNGKSHVTEAGCQMHGATGIGGDQDIGCKLLEISYFRRAQLLRDPGLRQMVGSRCTAADGIFRQWNDFGPGNPGKKRIGFVFLSQDIG